MKFTQSETEMQLNDAVPNGLKREISRRTGIYESIVYAYFNPHDERKSPQFQTLHIQAALDELNPEVGDAHWQAMERIREANKPASRTGKCIKAETGKLGKETSEFTEKVLTDAPFYDQLTEALQARDQIEECIKSILAAINVEKETNGGGRVRFGRAA